MTNLEFISSALRLIGVISEIETPSAEQGSHALERQNQMFEAWTESGINLGYFEQSSTTDDLPIPKWAERGAISKFAMDLQSTYPGSPLAAEVLDDERNGYGMILRKCMVESMRPARMDHMPGGAVSENIITGQ